ncbi:MAG TPA: exo-alpha-sialidase, partial [Armatimonadetes bacterium]|nr:exo-alpha-sialidase [Armatimonadota bacterium]
WHGIFQSQVALWFAISQCATVGVTDGAFIGVFETVSPLGMGAIVQLRDGRLMLISGNRACFSSDGGRTWSKPKNLPTSFNGVIRLQSGALGAYSSDLVFYISRDDGKTWERRGKIAVSSWRGSPYYDTMIQTSSGRLILPVRCTAAGHRGIYERTGAHGIIAGELLKIEGHAHWPEADIAFVYYSDDEGRTWHCSEGHIIGWHEDGYGGMWPCDEPNVVELRDGRLMMFCRTTLGRIYRVYSNDGGAHWDLPEVTNLASSYSPCRLRRIPKTGDLLCIWNQVSGDEIRAGYRRGRLSCAISRDDGQTWEHFRTIDRIVLPIAGCVKPDHKPGMVRGLDFVGELPDEYGNVSYPNVAFFDDKAILMWLWQRVRPREGKVKLRIVSVEWFYQDEKLPKLSKPIPRVIIAISNGKGGYKYASVHSEYIDGRFWVKLSDVARTIGVTIKHDMRAPLNQCITCLGFRAKYHDEHMDDPHDPRLYAFIVGRIEMR